MPDKLRLGTSTKSQKLSEVDIRIILSIFKAMVDLIILLLLAQTLTGGNSLLSKVNILSMFKTRKH
jgi:hypothetical protein